MKRKLLPIIILLAVIAALASCAKTGAEQNMTKTTLVLVGDFLGAGYERSRLYAPDFATEYRKASC